MLRAEHHVPCPKHYALYGTIRHMLFSAMHHVPCTNCHEFFLQHNSSIIAVPIQLLYPVPLYRKSQGLFSVIIFPKGGLKIYLATWSIAGDPSNTCILAFFKQPATLWLTLLYIMHFPTNLIACITYPFNLAYFS